MLHEVSYAFHWLGLVMGTKLIDSSRITNMVPTTPSFISYWPSWKKNITSSSERAIQVGLCPSRMKVNAESPGEGFHSAGNTLAGRKTNEYEGRAVGLAAAEKRLAVQRKIGKGGVLGGRDVKGRSMKEVIAEVSLISVDTYSLVMTTGC